MPILRLPLKLGLGEVPQAKSFQLSYGKKGNVETIKMMQKVARERARHPKIRQFVLNILHQAGVPSHNHAEEARVIGEFVKDYVRYVKDPDGIELLTDPLTLIDQIERGVAQGDCDDMALLVATMLLVVGIQPHFRAVRYKTLRGHYNHIYVLVFERDYKTPTYRIVLDAILKEYPIGAEIPHASGDNFPV